jgi:hypothetical protein
VAAGTTHNARPGILETMIEAVRSERVSIIATIGSNGDPERFGPVVVENDSVTCVFTLLADTRW